VCACVCVCVCVTIHSTRHVFVGRLSLPTDAMRSSKSMKHFAAAERLWRTLLCLGNAGCNAVCVSPHWYILLHRIKIRKIYLCYLTTVNQSPVQIIMNWDGCNKNKSCWRNWWEARCPDELHVRTHLRPVAVTAWGDQTLQVRWVSKGE
jgi:hypothetical protein